MHRWMLTNRYFGEELSDYKSGLGIPRRVKIIAVTSIVLLILAVRLAAGSLHEFYEAGLLALPHQIEQGVEFMTRDSISTLILIAMIALPVLTMLPGKWLRPISERAAR